MNYGDCKISNYYKSEFEERTQKNVFANKKRQCNHNKMLLDQFDLLNAFLEQDNVNIEIDITSAGKRGYTYKLINYKLDFRKKYISLELKIDEYVFTKNITAINDIQMASLGDGFYYFIKYLYVDPLDEERKVHKDTSKYCLLLIKYHEKYELVRVDETGTYIIGI